MCPKDTVAEITSIGGSRDTVAIHNSDDDDSLVSLDKPPNVILEDIVSGDQVCINAANKCVVVVDTNGGGGRDEDAALVDHASRNGDESDSTFEFLDDSGLVKGIKSLERQNFATGFIR